MDVLQPLLISPFTMSPSDVEGVIDAPNIDATIDTMLPQSSGRPCKL